MFPNKHSDGALSIDFSHYDSPGVNFMVCGSVDNGKSTLLGRLLYDCGCVYEDQISMGLPKNHPQDTSIENVSIDYSQFLDGLQDERSQNITIDVAYRYFRTKKRNFILLDTPGHNQYIKNMALAASKAQVAIVVIDVQEGITPTLKTHIEICGLMGIREFILCINKLDLIGYEEKKYWDLTRKIKEEILSISNVNLTFVPVSAVDGVNITKSSANTSWYKGLPLVEIMENTKIEESTHNDSFYLPVQLVVKDLSKKFRGYCGLTGGGAIAPGEKIVVYPSKVKATIKSIYEGGGEVSKSSERISTLITLEENVDISKGDFLVGENNKIPEYNQFKVKILWFSNEQPLLKSKRYIFKHCHSSIPGMVTKVKEKISILNKEKSQRDQINCNEIAVCDVYLDKKIPYMPYDKEPNLGSFIVIDRVSLETVGVGIIDHELDKSNNIISNSTALIGKEERSLIKTQRPFIIWFTGLSGAGKTTLANRLEKKLFDHGKHTFVLDGDIVRSGLNLDLGFKDSDRIENMRRIGEVAKLFLDAGIIILVATISPFSAERDELKFELGEDFVEVFVDASLETCRERDSKGLYKKQSEGKARNFTGIDSPYEIPQNPNITLEANTKSPDDLCEALFDYLANEKMIERNH